MHFPGLSRSGSGTWVLHKGADSVGPAFCTLPGSKHLRWPGAWSPGLTALSLFGLSFFSTRSLRWLITSPIPATRFSGCTTSASSQVCRVSLLGSWSLAATLPADVDCPESQEVLVSNKACLQFGRWCFSGAAIAPFQLWLPSPACLCWGMGRSAAG